MVMQGVCTATGAHFCAASHLWPGSVLNDLIQAAADGSICPAANMAERHPMQCQPLTSASAHLKRPKMDYRQPQYILPRISASPQTGPLICMGCAPDLYGLCRC